MENNVEFRLEKMQGNYETKLEMATSPAIALAVMASGICNIANHIREEDGEEAYMLYLDMVGEILSPKNLWSAMNGNKCGFKYLLKKIFK